MTRDPFYFSDDKRFTAEELAAWQDKEQCRERLARNRLKWYSLALQVGMFVLILLLWRLPFMMPIRLVVVLFHEMSHVIGAYLTGGVAFGIAIDPGGAGATLGIGGNDVLVASAGYLGSLLIGVVLYCLSAAWEPKEAWAMLMALFCIALLFGWLNGFTAFFGYLCIILMTMGFVLFRDGMKVFFIRVVSTTCCLFPIIDVM
ncbi:MAG TPA: M50 family metallopeptidase, partial [bacterium]|nr:M50 family metallopeptidase [bacterium]